MVCPLQEKKENINNNKNNDSSKKEFGDVSKNTISAIREAE